MFLFTGSTTINNYFYYYFVDNTNLVVKPCTNQVLLIMKCSMTKKNYNLLI